MRGKGKRGKGDAGQKGKSRKQPNQFAGQGSTRLYLLVYFFLAHNSLKSGIEKVQRIEVGRGTAMPNAEHPLPCSPCGHVASNMKSAQMES